jgi:uncharacterized protein YbjT (DUF2867 family)
MARVLVLGATGYVGGRLVPRLLEDGHNVSCLVRNPRRLENKPWGKNVTVYKGDVLDVSTLTEPFRESDIIYYLIHSMGSGGQDFEALDRTAARNAARTAEENNSKRIIYLGGLGKTDGDQSPHLRSRNEVAEILRSHKTPVTIFRAAVIVGSGSLSFELIHHLVNRLPVMICPRWIYSKTQPIGIADVLAYLREAIAEPLSADKNIDIGGPDIMNYGDMMMAVANELKLRRYLIPVPVLTPRLSSYWVNLVTPIPSSVANALIESLRYDTVCDNSLASEIFDIAPLPFKDAVRRALNSVATHNVETLWTGAGGDILPVEIDPTHFKKDIRTIEVKTSVENLFSVIKSIGGENGWYYADWLWRFRGFLDKQMGGVGLRRGRRDPIRIEIGEPLDFWRVEEYIENNRLRLKAEMKVGGHVWLEFEVESIDDNKSRLTQTAEFYPRGLWGLLYWYSIYPIHALVFRGLIRSIARRAEHLVAAIRLKNKIR